MKLVANGKTLTAAVQVKLDPRIKMSPAAVAQVSQLERKLAVLVGTSSEIVLEARSASEQLEALAAKPKAPKQQIEQLGAKIEALLEGPKDPPLTGDRAPTLARTNGVATSLYKSIAIDAPPTAAQLAEAARLERELPALAKSWTALKADAPLTTTVGRRTAADQAEPAERGPRRRRVGAVPTWHLARNAHSLVPWPIRTKTRNDSGRAVCSRRSSRGLASSNAR